MKEPVRPRIAFLGLGAMGRPMATRLAREGFELSVWTRDDGPSYRAVPTELRPLLAATPRECASSADIVVSMLKDGRVVSEVLSGRDGVLAGLRRRAIVIDMSTSGRAAALAAGRRVRAAGGRFIDAPVSGSVQPAATGQLVALAGARAKDLADARPVLDVLCKTVIHAGAVGQGQALKVILNGVGAHHIVAFTSMLVLGQKAGLARATLVDAFTSGAFATPSAISKKAKVLAKNYDPEFFLALALKDSLLNVQLQRELGVTLNVHRACSRAMAEAVRAGLGEQDIYALEKYFARTAARPRRRSRS